MTTITTAQPIPSSAVFGLGLRRHLVTFLAGAFLAGAAATGITAAVAHDRPATVERVVYVGSPSPAAACSSHAPSPC